VVSSYKDGTERLSRTAQGSRVGAWRQSDTGRVAEVGPAFSFGAGGSQADGGV
jgi:hypothetical protein